MKIRIFIEWQNKLKTFRTSFHTDFKIHLQNSNFESYKTTLNFLKEINFF